MEKQKKSVIVKLRTIVWCILAILLFAAPCGAQFVDIGETADIDYAIEDDFLLVLGTANLYPGAYVDWGIYASNGCTVNIYGGEIGDGFFVLLYNGEPMPVVTVYGMDFKLNGVPLDPSTEYFMTDSSGLGLLTGNYENGDPIDLLFYSDVPIFLKSPDAGLVIDIKPGNEQNNINLKSNGVVPVAILTTDNLNAAMIDPATAELAGAAPEHWSLEDVDDDGKDDLLLHFRTQELDLDQDSTEATLTAQMMGQLAGPMTIQSMAQVSGGSIVSGTDVVQIVSSKKSKK